MGVPSIKKKVFAKKYKILWSSFRIWAEVLRFALKTAKLTLQKSENLQTAVKPQWTDGMTSSWAHKEWNGQFWGVTTLLLIDSDNVSLTCHFKFSNEKRQKSIKNCPH